jgi:dipeptidyl aminopeptidase/acylaminoacyl peptidase
MVAPVIPERSSRLITLATAGTVAIAVVPSSSGTPTAASAFAGREGALVFLRRANEADLWRAASDGTDLRRLTFSGGATEFGPTWSPDGRRIAFYSSSGRFPGGQIYVMPADGRVGTPRRLTTDRGEVHSPTWSPDGSRIAFIASVRGRPREQRLDVMHANGSDRRTLVRLRTRFASEPAWSPDGTRIAYTIDHQIYVTSSAGGNRGKLVARGDEPDWSPDGRRLAFRRNLQAFVVGADGSDERRLAPTLQLEPPAGPAWSPDGNSLAVSVDTGGTCGDPRFFGAGIAIVAAEGTQSRLLFGCGTAEDADPAWQPICTIYGSDGNDALTGTTGADVICGLRGNDRIAGYGGDDVIIGGDGDDTIYGGAGSDRLFGSAGDDRLRASGDATADIVNGGPGRDVAVIDDRLDVRWELEVVRTPS